MQQKHIHPADAAHIALRNCRDFHFVAPITDNGHVVAVSLLFAEDRNGSTIENKITYRLARLSDQAYAAYPHVWTATVAGEPLVAAEPVCVRLTRTVLRELENAALDGLSTEKLQAACGAGRAVSLRQLLDLLCGN
ncbi:hypothetical protein ACLKMY_32915 [Paraburkholderia mimosarum]|uniref:hypothetical protein n=1 Tax=Paraburkholderia mimosarum TaxID=312026 RepID=UPI0039C2EB9D